MDELVLSIRSDVLWGIISYKKQGLIKARGDVLKRIVRNCLFRNRSELEEDPSIKQIISYGIISCKDSFYLFKRTSNQTEKRLHNKFSLGVGGHMNPANTAGSEKEYLIAEFKRELFEEVRLSGDCLIENIEFLGFINDDTIPVGTVHTGLLYIVHVSDKEVYINESDKMTAEWIDKTDLPDYYEAMETWSKIVVDEYISKYL